jgi:FkbM family methyltransferase
VRSAKFFAKLRFAPLTFIVHWTISRRAKAEKEFFFIQVGANDGKTGDPVHEYIKKYHWKGILVEPIPYLFRKLQQTYAGMQGLVFENVAIDKRDGQRTLYRVEENSEPNNPFWYDQLGSFSKEFVLRHRDMVPNLEAHLLSEDVPCLSMGSLLRKHGIRKLNFLHIDTEGYDYEIIKTVPFGTVKPDMILYEHQHLSDRDRKECFAFLRDLGYKVLKLRLDTFAYLPSDRP